MSKTSLTARLMLHSRRWWNAGYTQLWMLLRNDARRSVHPVWVKRTECWYFCRRGTHLPTIWCRRYMQLTSPVSVLPGRCGAKSSNPIPALCLYPWAKLPRRGKPSPSQLLVPRSTAAASFRKATQRLTPLCSPPSWTSPTWGNAL